MTMLLLVLAVFLIAAAAALPAVGQIMRQMINFVIRVVGVAFVLAITIIVLVEILTHGALI